ncbi:hypothetical protein, partial [Bathymodiolus platifrons methanotrophic gill symbiont]|uniref:hypothetical protein n=1 Tax=Bathymodiolus platifrons methanotrophic gill symbiont TaxID=113268 RepID=UPI001B7D8764
KNSVKLNAIESKLSNKVTAEHISLSNELISYLFCSLVLVNADLIISESLCSNVVCMELA